MIPIAKPMIGKEEVRAVEKVLKSGMLAQGKKVEELERKFSEYIGTKYAVAVNSGTSALHLALLALGIGKFDEVITTPFSFISSSNCILFVGAKPVFTDVSEDDFNIDPSLIEQKITMKTKALLIVHLYGQPCDMNPILKIIKKYNLFLIEDACQSHGAEYEGKKVGSFGEVGCFSFYPTKNMTTGEGGMVVTNQKWIADKVILLRNHGQKKEYFYELLGYNFRMTDIAAAIGLIQLKRLEKFNKKRAINASYLNRGLLGIKEIITPKIFFNRRHVFYQYTIRVTKKSGLSREKLEKELKRNSVKTGIYYPRLIPDQGLYRKIGYRGKEDFPVARRLTREVLSLPVHPRLKKEELGHIVKVIEKAIPRRNSS